MERLIIDAKGTEKIVYPKPEIIVTPPKRPELTTYEEALEWNKLHQKHTEQAVSFTQEYAKVEFNPIASSNRVLLINIADLHWGHLDVDYDFLDKNLSIIEYTPNVAGILTWNILDAAIPAKFPDGIMWSGQTAQEQVYTFRDKLKKMYEKGKIIAAIGDASCHEGWAKRATGWMIYRELFDDIGIPLLLNGGYLDVQVGQENYRLGLFHRTRFWSALNKTHGGDRMMDRISDSEIIFTSHLHRAAVQRSVRYNPPFRKDTAVVSSGTSKLFDKYFRSTSGEEGEPGFQGIILWADKHKFEVIFDLEAGEELMLDAIKDEEQKKINLLRKEISLLKNTIK